MPCQPPKTNADKIWIYEQYGYGENDEENRKSGIELHHWTGAESQEWYKGAMLRDTMHGFGDYRWRYLGATHEAVTYEGWFYNNRMHGYGAMSYPDGRVYNGLFCLNNRWGPGVEHHACLREDVGFWCGTQLLRLAWLPGAPSVAIDLVSVPMGHKILAPHRALFITNATIIGEVNSALELLKQNGSEPLAAADKWTKLYSKSCTDTKSRICQVELFDRAYYGNTINTLTNVSSVPEVKGESVGSKDDMDRKIYYAWNNNDMIVHMMKHCYKHEAQRRRARINLVHILSGPRTAFKPPGKQELNCRTVLMACYLGHIANVAQLINEHDVHPNIADMQGNTALMYAACGDQPEIIHFLVQTGSDIDHYNDACCTPLGVALLRYALVRLDIAPIEMPQALLPPSAAAAPSLSEEGAVEWHMERDLTASVSNVPQKTPSKTLKTTPPKKMTSLKDLMNNTTKKKSDSTAKLEESKKNVAAEMFPEEKKLYTTMNNEYLIKVIDAFSMPSEANPIPYIFEVRDMSQDVNLTDEEQKKVGEKIPKKNLSKLVTETTKPSREIMKQSEKELNTVNTKEQLKQATLDRIMLTVIQLLSDGANPRKVRCPQPPLFIATVARSSELVRHLVRYGADVNEVYPNALGYSALDAAVSGPLTYDNLELIRSLLESGADADHRLPVKEPQATNITGVEINPEDGPTLLLAVLGRKTDFEPEEELHRKMLELLLEYGSNPMTQTKGRSAMDMAMSKNMNLFDIFIKSPKTDLNAVINNDNQTILTKMFYLPYCKTVPLTDRLQMLTNLLLYGADPLMKCQNGEEKYANLFVFARKVLSEVENLHKPSSPTGSGRKSKTDTKGKKQDKPKKDNSKPAKALAATKPQGTADEISDYKQTLDLVVECARLLHIRWLQAKLMKELIEIVNKYKHRQWNMILKEHKNKKCTGLWLSANRCLEIWDTLKTTKKNVYNDNRILRHVLCIVHYYYKRTWKILRFPTKYVSMPMTAPEKELIEHEVANLIQEHKSAMTSTPGTGIRPYVTPELTVRHVEKFNVCFECALPLEDAKIPCGSCKLIAFCSFDCMKRNINRINCHPCSTYLQQKYFPSPEEAEANID